MPVIDFESQYWQDAHNDYQANGTQACDDGPAGNTLADANDPNQVQFIIAQGSMHPDSITGSTRFLFFTPADCPGINHPAHPATLVIRLDQGYGFVNFKLACNSAFPVIVWYYENSKETGEMAVEARTISSPSNAFFDVAYNSPCFPVKEIVIRSGNPENSIDDLEFGPAHTFLVFTRWYCLLRRLGIRLRDLVLTRTGPMRIRIDDGG